jgi:mediator of RNA polymerase II transcription subunit 6
MDENPLQGEPGAFVFASTNQQVEARNKAQAAAAAQAALNVPVKARDGEADSAVNSVAPTPRPVGHVGVGAGGVGAESRKASVIGLPPAGKADKKRRKSKGPGSPTSPTSATSLTGPGL